MFGFLRRQTCSQCGVASRGKGLDYAVPGIAKTRWICGQPCLDAARAADEAELQRRRRERAAENEALRASLREAHRDGTITNLTTESRERPRVAVLGSLPVGVPLDAWPKASDGPMLHVASFDLAALGRGRGGLGVYVEAWDEGYGWTCGGEVRCLEIEDLRVHPSCRAAEVSRFPVGLLSPVDLFATDETPAFDGEGHDMPSYAGGKPLSFEAQAYEHEASLGAFIAQVSGRHFEVAVELEDLFGELAGLYLFERGAHLAMFG